MPQLNQISRRTALLGTSALTLAALAACAGQTAAQVTQEIITDGTGIANGLATFVTTAQGIPSTVAATITGWAKDAVAAAGKLSTAMSLSAGQTIAQQISTDVSSVAQAVAGFNIGPAAQALLNDLIVAIQIFLPLFVSIVGTATVVAPNSAGAAAMARLNAAPTVVLQ